MPGLYSSIIVLAFIPELIEGPSRAAPVSPPWIIAGSGKSAIDVGFF
jgi:hypothetical protein